MKKIERARFYGVWLFAVALALYFLLTMSIFLILGIQALPDLARRYPAFRQMVRFASEQAALGEQSSFADLSEADEQEILERLEAAGIEVPDFEGRPEARGSSLIVQHLIIVPIVTLVGAAALVQPYKRFLRLKARDESVPARLSAFCQRTIRLTPLFFAGLVLLPHIILGLTVTGGLLAGTNYAEAGSGSIGRFLIVGLAAAFLQALVVYSWQRYRVQMHYLDHFFTREELETAQQPLRIRRLSTRLWVSNTMTTFLPIMIIVSYVWWSIAPARNLEGLSSDQLAVLLGDYAGILTLVDSEASFLAEVLAWVSDSIGTLWYVNAIDTALMFGGIVSGALISVVYVVLLVRWTTGSIVGPVQEVLRGMRQSADGEFDHHTIVRERDEIGELSIGFNRMNDQLGSYFTRISQLNEAYFQFVPERFLEILGRDHIEEVRLGDQIQREMTLLFSDIRSFTSLSERMTPEESFRFINTYLGAMEPAITSNEGFIDKYIGDAIMAIFDASPDASIQAGLAMRRSLEELNRDREQSGDFRIDIGIGIHTGNLMLGLVGSAQRMDGTVISDAVNLASRLEGLTKAFGCRMIASSDTIERTSNPDRWAKRELGRVLVSGRADPVGIAEILDLYDETDAAKAERSHEFAAALQAYQSAQFEMAAEQFQDLAGTTSGDGPALYFAARAGEKQQAQIEEWDGIEEFRNK